MVLLDEFDSLSHTEQEAALCADDDALRVSRVVLEVELEAFDPHASLSSSSDEGMHKHLRAKAARQLESTPQHDLVLSVQMRDMLGISELQQRVAQLENELAENTAGNDAARKRVRA